MSCTIPNLFFRITEYPNSRKYLLLITPYIFHSDAVKNDVFLEPPAQSEREKDTLCIPIASGTCGDVEIDIEPSKPISELPPQSQTNESSSSSSSDDSSDSDSDSDSSSSSDSSDGKKDEKEIENQRVVFFLFLLLQAEMLILLLVMHRPTYMEMNLSQSYKQWLICVWQPLKNVLDDFRISTKVFTDLPTITTIPK